eukprot:scpid27870/ scgid1966/ 
MYTCLCSEEKKHLSCFPCITAICMHCALTRYHVFHRVHVICVCLQSNFTLAQFGLILASISDTTALPAPIGAPFMDVASNPFEERKVEVHSEVPASTSGQTVRASTIMTFDPVFGTTGGEQQPSADGFETDFASLGADPAAVADPDSQVYAVPRFPPIRAVLGDDECDTGRDSGALFS